MLDQLKQLAELAGIEEDAFSTRLLHGGSLYEKTQTSSPHTKSFENAVRLITGFIDELPLPNSQIAKEELKHRVCDAAALHLSERVMHELDRFMELRLRPPVRNSSSAVVELKRLEGFLCELMVWQMTVESDRDWRSTSRVTRGAMPQLDSLSQSSKGIETSFGRNVRDCVVLLVNIVEISEKGLPDPKKPTMWASDDRMPRTGTQRPTNGRPTRGGFEE
jgi:hypothetical protein